MPGDDRRGLDDHNGSPSKMACLKHVGLPGTLPTSTDNIANILDIRGLNSHNNDMIKTATHTTRAIIMAFLSTLR